MISKFLSQARKGANNPMMYLITIILVFAAYFIGQIPFSFIGAYMHGKQENTSKTLYDALSEMDMEALGLDKNLGFLLLLLMFVFALIALFICVRWIHRRPIHTLVNSAKGIHWGKVFFGFFVWFGLGLLAEGLAWVNEPSNYEYTLNLTGLIPLILICILVLPLQTSFEEFFFRGYLLQGLASFFNHKLYGSFFNTRIFLILLIAVLFSLVHAANPEIAKYGLGIMLANYIAAGLFLGILVVMDDSLELALGVHAATNFFAAVIANYESSAIQTYSIMKILNLDPKVTLIVLIISGSIFTLICAKKYSWPSFGLLFSQIDLENYEKEIIHA